MEHLKSYYTLEKHLEESACVNKQFEILNAIWKLNKRNLSSALSNISQYYPHYSLHEKSHSRTILSNIESFLGENRIKTLSPTNTWLILMSAYTHDLGMVVFQDLIQKDWLSDNFQDFLNEISESDNIDLKLDAEILINIQNIRERKDNVFLEEITPIKIKNSVTTIVAEYIRRIHHERSSDIIKGTDKQFYEIANSFYSEQIPNRLLNILGEIAFLHGVEFYEIFRRVEFESNGISSDKINPRFIACLLRLGDLLDLDDSRFNPFTRKVFEYPELSNLHYQKHSSIKHILITPEAIEITSDCPNEDVYRIARSWFDWLEDEVEKQAKEWSNIAPTDLKGSSPTIPKGKIKVYYKNQEVDDQLLNLRFEVSNQKIFEILEGGSIYENAELTFIRELVQNALDASKIQLWKEIEKGTFDFAFKSHFKNKLLKHNEIIEKINFPVDIPDSLYESFEVKLNIKWKNLDKEVLSFEISDNGTGISDTDLIRITNKVGESRKKDKIFKRFLKRVPFWLKPTGAFGIGLQSVFIITDNFNVTTKAEGEQAKEIKFRSSKKGKYSSVSNTEIQENRGTTVIVNISKDKFAHVFGSTFSWDIIRHYDYFTDKHDSIYIPKIRIYIDEFLSKVSNLSIVFFEENLNYENIAKSNDYTVLETMVDELKNIQAQLVISNKSIFFIYHENIIGSEFIYRFYPDFKHDIDENWLAYQTEYLVREIPVKDSTINYHRLSYSKLYWNFMSPESDKILSLTREKFIAKNKIEFQNTFLSKIVPTSIKLAENLFSANYKNLKDIYSFKDEKLSIIYFKILLTKKINEIDGHSANNEILSNAVIPQDLLEDFNGEKVSMSNFFYFDNIVVFVSDNYQFKNELNDIEKNKSDIINYFHNIPKEKVLLIKHNRFFHIYLLENYYINEIYFLDKSKIILLNKNKHHVEIKEGYDKYLKSILQSKSLLDRGISYVDNKYYSHLSIEYIYASGFEHFPYLSRTAVISPFKSYEEFILFKNSLSNNSYENITLEDIKKIVPNKLIKWVIKHKPQDIDARNEENVYNSYRDLILEFLHQL